MGISQEIIMFYNVENLFVPDPKPLHYLDPTPSGLWNWDQRRYENKLHKIVHVFQLIDQTEGIFPMFIGLSEIENRKVLEDLLKLIPFREHLGIIHYDSMDERGIDVAAIYDKRKLSLVESKAINFVFEVDENNARRDTTRDVLWCKMKYQNLNLNFFVLHLPSKREKDVNQPKRKYILEHIKSEIIHLIKKEKEAIIVCGDFNENPNEENMSSFLRDDDSEDSLLINPFELLYKNEKYSNFHQKNGFLFDQMVFSRNFIDENFPLKFENATVFNSDKISVWTKKNKRKPFRTYSGRRYLGGYSDHYPVITKFNFKS